MNIRIPVIFVLVLGVVVCAKAATKPTLTPSATTAPAASSKTATPAATSKSAIPSASSKSATPAASKSTGPAVSNRSAAPAAESKSSAPAASSTLAPQCTDTSSATPTYHALNLTPYTNVVPIPCNQNEEPSYVGQYTRLVIDSEQNCTDFKCETMTGKKVDSENYTYQNRSALTRYLFGKQFDFNLSAKITISTFYQATIPLVTIGHEGDSKGEQWARTISHELLDYPLFLVQSSGATGKPHFDVTLTADKTVDSNVASAALAVAVSAVQQASPGSSVLTTLTSDSSKAKSNAIDTAISSLFSDGIKEEHENDVTLTTWSSGDGIRIDVKLPRNENDWNRHLLPIGIWTIHFAPPRPSIFSDWRQCLSTERKLPDAVKKAIRCTDDPQTVLDNVRDDITPNTVLTYTVANTTGSLNNIQAFITQNDWYTSTITKFKTEKTKADSQANQATADELCQKIDYAIVGLKLNEYDAEIVIWAIAYAMPKTVNVTRKVFLGTDGPQQMGICLRAIKEVEQHRKVRLLLEKTP